MCALFRACGTKLGDNSFLMVALCLAGLLLLFNVLFYFYFYLFRLNSIFESNNHEDSSWLPLASSRTIFFLNCVVQCLPMMSSNNNSISVTTATILSCYLLFCYFPIAFIVVDDAEAGDVSGADFLGYGLVLGLGLG